MPKSERDKGTENHRKDLLALFNSRVNALASEEPSDSSEEILGADEVRDPETMLALRSSIANQRIQRFEMYGDVVVLGKNGPPIYNRTTERSRIIWGVDQVHLEVKASWVEAELDLSGRDERFMGGSIAIRKLEPDGIRDSIRQSGIIR